MPAKILVVDDETDLEPLLRQKFRKQIRHKELEFIFAHNGVEALEILDTQTDVDMVLTDINMPQMDGLTLLNHINTRFPSIKTVILSAYGDMESIRTAMNLGAFDFLTKPLNFQDLEITTKKTLLAATQFKKAQEQERLMQQAVALQESERRLMQFLEAVPVGLFIIDKVGKPFYINQRAKMILGEELMPDVVPEDLPQVYQAYRNGSEQLYEGEQQPIYRALQGESSSIDDLELRRDDRIIPLEVSATPIFDEEGEIIYAIAAFQDITQRKQAETERLRFTQELEAKNADLERLDRLKDEFLAHTSHELRSPLHGLIGLAESLQERTGAKLSEVDQANLTAIIYSGKRLAALVNDLLDFSKLKNQDLILQTKPLDFRQITEIILTLSQPLAKSKNITLHNHIDPEMTLVEGDENRLQQILYHLVGNGIKFTEGGSVEVMAKVQETMLAITVADTGIGISPGQLENIFNNFEVGDVSLDRPSGGMGLGLKITKKLVELHGGTLTIASELQKGTRVTFTLPLSTTTTRPQPLSLTSIDSFISLTLPTVPVYQIPVTEHQFTILAVDDDPINLQLVINYLSLEKYQVIPANNGQEALKLINNGLKPDLVLLDVMMPKMTGYEVCQRIRQKFPVNEMPILMMTGNERVSELINSLNAGANDYLTKPISKNELLTRTKNHLQLSKTNLAYGRFVPREFLGFLERESILDVHLGDSVQKELSILFSDIRSFTSLSEQMSPDDNVRFINAYLSRMEPAILDNHGFIDKYIGDAIMALFGRGADDAVKAAIAMLNILTEYNLTRQRPNRPPIQIGIGINTGSAILGTIGGSNRMETTAIGDAVNIAARLESLTKMYGALILVGGATFEALLNPNDYHYRFLSRVQVKGKNEFISVFEICNADPPKMRDLKMSTKTRLEEGIIAYETNKIGDAGQIFEEIVSLNPLDRAAQFYLTSCQEIMAKNSHFQETLSLPNANKEVIF